MTEIRPIGVWKDIDLEEENLVSSSSNGNRKIVFQATQVSSIVNSSSSSTNQIFNRLLTNIQVVIFGTKINTLLPFGLLAIVLHYFSNRNVCFLLDYIIDRSISNQILSACLLFTGFGFLLQLDRYCSISRAVRLCH